VTTIALETTMTVTTTAASPQSSPLPSPTPAGSELTATVAVNALREAVTWASWAISKRPPMQCLLGVLLVAKRGALTVTGYDYNDLASQQVLAPNATGRALVPAEQLKRMLAVLPNGSDVHLSVAGNVLHLTGGDRAGRIEFRLPLLQVEDYPDLPVPGPVLLPSIPGTVLTQLGRTCFAAGRDDTLPVLTGVHLSPSSDGGVQAAATDRYRLAVMQAPDVPWPQDVTVLVPATVLAKAASGLGWAKAVTVSHDNTPGSAGWITFEGGGRVLTSRTIEGEFPRYRSLVPTSAEFHFYVDKTDLITAVQRAEAAGSSRYSTNPVGLHATKDGGNWLKRSHPGNETDASSSVFIPGAYTEGLTDDAFTVAFNPQYLAAGLKQLPPGKVAAAFNGPNKPMDPSFQYLLMPVREITP
jgi:DNA polymerase-3 subunit beta